MTAVTLHISSVVEEHQTFRIVHAADASSRTAREGLKASALEGPRKGENLRRSH